MLVPHLNRGRSLVCLLNVVAFSIYLGVAGLTKAPDDTPAVNQAPALRIGPVDGLTTAWHSVPERISIPLGSSVEFFQAATANSMVTWIGAEELFRDNEGSTSSCQFNEIGEFTVGVTIVEHDRGASRGNATMHQCECNVVDIDPADIVVAPVNVWVDPVVIDQGLPDDKLNASTMHYYFGESIADLKLREDGSYLTSVDRKIQMEIAVTPAEFEPLIEWRFNGKSSVTDIGANRNHIFIEKGIQSISVGPLANSRETTVETYNVSITSRTSNENESDRVVFEAVTDPPGYENEIRWLSSTKYGSAQPVLGSGPNFVVEFTDTFGPLVNDPNNAFEWFGVKAGNARFNHDETTPTFNDMVFDKEVVEVQFGGSVFENFIIDGEFTVNPLDGVVNGEATVRFPDARIGTIFVQDDILEVVYGNVVIDARTDMLAEIVEVNGMEVSVDSVMEVLFEENDFTGSNSLSDQSRALITLQVLAQTSAFQHNVGVAQQLRFGESFWCKAWCLTCTTVLIALGAVTCAALAATCVPPTVLIPGIGQVSCGSALILCNALVAGAFGLYGLVVQELWRS